MEQELLECQTLVEEADRLSTSVGTAAGVSDMVAEYRALFADVRTRLELARAEVGGDVDSAVQVTISLIYVIQLSLGFFLVICWEYMFYSMRSEVFDSGEYWFIKIPDVKRL